MKKGCKSCRFSVSENDTMICNFPMIAEMFLDGTDENPTNMSNGGADCKRYDSRVIGFQKTVEQYKEDLKNELKNNEKINCEILEL